MGITPTLWHWYGVEQHSLRWQPSLHTKQMGFSSVNCRIQSGVNSNLKSCSDLATACIYLPPKLPLHWISVISRYIPWLLPFQTLSTLPNSPAPHNWVFNQCQTHVMWLRWFLQYFHPNWNPEIDMNWPKALLLNSWFPILHDPVLGEELVSAAAFPWVIYKWKLHLFERKGSYSKTQSLTALKHPLPLLIFIIPPSTKPIILPQQHLEWHIPWMSLWQPQTAAWWLWC